MNIPNKIPYDLISRSRTNDECYSRLLDKILEFETFIADDSHIDAKKAYMRQGIAPAICPVKVGDRFTINSHPITLVVTDLAPEHRAGYIQAQYWKGENLMAEYFTEEFIQSQIK